MKSILFALLLISITISFAEARKRHQIKKAHHKRMNKDDAAAAADSNKETDESHEEKIKNMGYFYIEYPLLIDDEPNLKPQGAEGAAGGEKPAEGGAEEKKDEPAAKKVAMSKHSKSHAKSKTKFKEEAAKEGEAKEGEAKEGEAKEGDAKAAGTQGKPAVFEGKKKQKLGILNNKDKLVLPMYCKSKLEAKEIYGLATHSQDYVNAWREAAAQPDAEADALPQLEPAAFAKFYATVTADMLMDVGMLGSKEAEEKADDLAATINYQNKNLKKVSWFQFWVFLCSEQVMPAKHEYMAKEPATEDAFLDKLKKKMKGGGKKKVTRVFRMRGRSRIHHPFLKRHR